MNWAILPTVRLCGQTISALYWFLIGLKWYYLRTPKVSFLVQLKTNLIWVKFLDQDIGFVSLHEKGSSYALLTLSELEGRIKNKRIQFQIFAENPCYKVSNSRNATRQQNESFHCLEIFV